MHEHMPSSAAGATPEVGLSLPAPVDTHEMELSLLASKVTPEMGLGLSKPISTPEMGTEPSCTYGHC